MKKFEYQVVRYHEDQNFLYRQFFHLRKFKLLISTKSWIAHKLYETICENCGFSTTPSQHFVKCKNGLYIKCRSWWVEQYWYSWLFQSRPSRVSKTNAWLWIFSKFKIEWFKVLQMKTPDSILEHAAEALFTSWTKRFRDTVALSFVYGNYCLIMD